MQVFCSVKLIKEGFFSKWRGGGWTNKDSFELVREGIINFNFVIEESKREGICIKWWDQQFYNNTHLLSHNKYLECYLLKKELYNN